MKRFIAYSLLAFYLFSTTEAHELLRFPLLVEHFKEHQQTDTQISLVRFLNIHYSNDIEKDADHEKDMELPFKSHHNNHGNQFIFILIPNDYPLALISLLPSPKILLKYYPALYHNTALNSIWQPPRIG